MFFNITSQRPSINKPEAPKKMMIKTTKRSLHIAIGVALTFFTIQAQAADTTQTKILQPMNTNIAVQNGSAVSEGFIVQQAALFF